MRLENTLIRRESQTLKHVNDKNSKILDNRFHFTKIER